MKKLRIKLEETFFCSCGNAYYPHKYVKIPAKHQKGSHRGYSFEVLGYCCEEMETAIANWFVKLGTDSCLDKPEDKRVNIIMPSWEDTTELSSINFCPYCGAKIIIEE